jgi:hypothetical protein
MKHALTQRKEVGFDGFSYLSIASSRIGTPCEIRLELYPGRKLHSDGGGGDTTSRMLASDLLHATTLVDPVSIHSFDWESVYECQKQSDLNGVSNNTVSTVK